MGEDGGQDGWKLTRRTCWWHGGGVEGQAGTLAFSLIPTCPLLPCLYCHDPPHLPFSTTMYCNVEMTTSSGGEPTLPTKCPACAVGSDQNACSVHAFSSPYYLLSERKWRRRKETDLASQPYHEGVTTAVCIPTHTALLLAALYSYTPHCLFSPHSFLLSLALPPFTLARFFFSCVIAYSECRYSCTFPTCGHFITYTGFRLLPVQTFLTAYNTFATTTGTTWHALTPALWFSQWLTGRQLAWWRHSLPLWMDC